VKITTEDQINKYISKLCQKFKVNATVRVGKYNEHENEPFEHVYEVTNCYSDGTYGPFKK
jgi:hypothetical protein